MALRYVTLAAFENLLIRLCVGISIHGIATEDETNHKAAGYQNKLFSVFSELAVKIRQPLLNLNNSRAKLYLKHIFNGHQCDQEITKVRE